MRFRLLFNRCLSYFLLVILFCQADKLNAQDTLLMNDGSELYVKVLEIGENTISYKKNENLSGPIYTVDIGKVFMALYKGGKRETCINKDQGKDSTNTEISLKDGSFEAILMKADYLPARKKKAITIAASINVYKSGRLFTQVSLTAYQRTDVLLDFSSPKGNYLLHSQVTISPSENISKILWEKYENHSGKGYGWILPPKFFDKDLSACSVGLLMQKEGNKEIIGFGGISCSKFNLKDCSSIENKLLSIVFLWLEVNFKKQ